MNASAAEDVADPDLRDLLHYVATGRPDGALSREIDSLVEEYNRDREWVTKVLTYEQDTEMRCRRAEARGIEQGISRAWTGWEPSSASFWTRGASTMPGGFPRMLPIAMKCSWSSG